MTTATLKRTRIRGQSASTPACATALTGSALLKDMHAYGKKVSATPDSARDFLTRLGVLDKDGKQRKLIRG